MVGKTIKCDISLIQFFYPTFRVREQISFLNQEEDVIYVGKYKPGLKDTLEVYTHSYINTVGKVDEDYTGRQDLLEFVYSKWNRQVPQKLIDQMNELSDEEFIASIKTLWVCGKWPYGLEQQHTVYDLFTSMNDSLIDNLRTAIQLMGEYPIKVITSSLLTFLQRAMDIDGQDLSAQYKRVLKTFYQRSANKIRPAVMNYAYKQDALPETQLLELLFKLR